MRIRTGITQSLPDVLTGSIYFGDMQWKGNADSSTLLGRTKEYIYLPIQLATNTHPNTGRVECMETMSHFRFVPRAEPSIGFTIRTMESAHEEEAGLFH